MFVTFGIWYKEALHLVFGPYGAMDDVHVYEGANHVVVLVAFCYIPINREGMNTSICNNT